MSILGGGGSADAFADLDVDVAAFAASPAVVARPLKPKGGATKRAPARKKTKGDIVLGNIFNRYCRAGATTLSKDELGAVLKECALNDDSPPANSKYALFSPVRTARTHTPLRPSVDAAQS